jgi:single-strand DNA-binding protein
VSLNYNKVQLAGCLTRDPEIKFLPSDKAVAQFGLAINRKFKGPDGSTKEEPTFIDVEAWGRTAELVCQYLTKGSACFIEGRLKLDTWEDKNTGEKRSKLKVVADSVQFIGGRKEHDDQGAEAGDPPPARAPRPPTARSAGEGEPPF